MNNNETIINENKFTLTLEEMELSKNPESFKIYLEYRAKIQETMFAEAGKQRDKEFESLNLQREREFETIKWQREKEAETMKMIDQHRKDTWAEILGVGASLVENFCENNTNLSSVQTETPIDDDIARSTSCVNLLRRRFQFSFFFFLKLKNTILIYSHYVK